MASRYIHSSRSGLYHELKITISNDLVSRSKRPFDDFQEGEQALQPDVKKQRCSSPFLSQKTSLASTVPSSPSNGIAGSYSLISNGDVSDLDELLEFTDGESPDSPFSVTLEEEERLLADDPEIDTSDILLGVSVKKVGSEFAEVSLQVTQQQSVPKTPNVSPEPLPLTGLSVPSSSGLPHSSAPANPGIGSNTNVDSQNQTSLSWGPDGLGLQDVTSVETGNQKRDSGSGIMEKEATQTVEEESPVVSQLMAKCEFASVVTDRPSEGQTFIDQSEVGGESASDPPCEAQGESNSAIEGATEHPVIAPNEDRVEDPGPEEPEKPSPEESEDPGPDDSRRRRICIPEELLQWRKEKYVESVLAHAQHRNIIAPVNELRELMRTVASEYQSQEPNYRHPTDLTVRNYAQRANRKIQKCTLENWVNQNERHFRRFEGIPDKFKRSPIPSR
ncbi:S100P-binding protein [Heteronotia binoei]|uniref:S100P-binding protein n=1 Tax=Heteronotia binoei TaxID=13085 RepID=UPI00292CE9F0|nr:S100P-binding protein [Heteronotia binoei]XP_060114442.1 S100P-binding protein [Heteronotia binoei]